MNKLRTILTGITAACIATYLADKLFGIDFNLGNLYFIIGGMITGVLIHKDK
jgi:hypothetical protein